MNKSLKSFMAVSLILATALLPTNNLVKNAEKAIHQNSWEAKPLMKIKKAGTLATAGYSPAQIRKAYGVDKVSATGAGQTIAIVDAYGSPTMQNDLSVFSSQFGLAQANLSIAYPTGKPSTTDGGWALETAMDVEWAHAIAPGAKILLVVAKTASDSDLLAAIDYATSNGAQVVSNSWGGGEFSGESSYDTHFKHTGVTYLASSGDDGAGSEWPACSPYVLSVGGTTLNLDSAGNYLSETAWSGSGGDTSSYYSRPTYQSNWTSVVGSYRGDPDISWVADPSTGASVYSSTKDNGQSGWFVVGGTSLGSPSVAGVIALLNQNRGANYTSFDAISKLYSVAGTAGSTGYTTNFNDVKSGSNGGYSAKTGYDLVTGLGSPKVNNLLTSAK
ncbi:S53 family peptidase [Clostridium manihotivorum]|uniref:Peptidase S8 and S53 subtilisin kexin sedolisin n=1 Tax=Clostridium manihotivorum TaxID=2320868 RepID=A0A410DVM6_9CLOT|nr:S53 family peptidase [Clostridium manihotivorum]QAA33100.1 peptidase S8 and S53 subtilisin kexin sedolisin [Clostridium manihotivorum]